MRSDVRAQIRQVWPALKQAEAELETRRKQGTNRPGVEAPGAKQASRRSGGRGRQTVAESFAKSLMRSIGSSIGRSIARGILGSITGRR